MCGIIGYIGNNVVEKQLIEGLKKLEYRGYDSSGILTTKNHQFNVTKSLGPVKNLDEKITHYENTNCGIGHTRWATHGKVTIDNAHPQCSMHKLFALVHNGVIENYKSLRCSYLSNYSFSSQTDTEVIANLIEYLYEKNLNNKVESDTSLLKKYVLNCIVGAFSLIKGSYACSIVFSKLKDTIFVAKNKSPIYVTTNNKDTLIASDTICFAGYYNNYFELNDYEFCIASKQNIEFFDRNGNKINKKPKKLLIKQSVNETHSYSSLMLKEIYDTPTSLLNVCNFYKNVDIFKNISLDGINKVVLVGCGTAYHACMVGKVYFEHFNKIDSEAVIASEFNTSNKIIDKNTLCIFISQSGETLDTIIAKNYCKKNHAKIVVITNVLNSQITKNVKTVLPVLAGVETAVASTKAYSCQIAVLYLLCNYLCNNDIQYQKALKSLKRLAKNLKKIDKNYVFDLINALDNKNTLFLLGKNLDYITARESSLKIKEVTYINASAYPCGELKHGYIALIDNETTSIVFSNNKATFKKSLIACSEIKTRGGKVIFVTSLKLTNEHLKQLDMVDNIFTLPVENYYLSPILNIIPIQLISEDMAIKLGYNPDKPKNLAKSVTVE